MMIELIRGLSFVTYTYDGGPLRFNVPFPYVDQQHVRVFVGEPDSARLVFATWVDAATLDIPAQDEFLAAPYTVTIRRFTPFQAALISYQEGANLPAADLNKSIRQLLYLHQEFREFVEGGSVLPGGGGDLGPYPDISEIIDGLFESPGMQDLLTKIDLIDTNAETLLARILRDNAYDDTDRTVKSQLTTLESRVTTAETDAIANYLQLIQTLASETEARVMSDTTMLAQFNDDFSAYQNIIEVQVNAVESRVDATELLVAAHSDNIAAMETDIELRTTDEEASAIATTKVQAFANGTFAALQETFDTYVAGNDGRWDATWSVKINAGTIGGQPVMAGIALSAGTGSPSSFIVMADKFAIVHPSYTSGGTLANIKYPFVVGTVGGVTTVGITGALMVDGTITANKLNVTSLSAVTANAGTINGGTFKTHTLDVNGAIIDALEFRAEMSNVGTWPLWIGSGVKNQNNAVFWVDKLGNAGFDGTVKAPNIIDDFQRFTLVNWTGAVAIPTGAGFTQALTFSLPPPILVGQTHVPCVVVAVQSDLMLNPTYQLEWLNGSVWTKLSSTSFGGVAQFAFSDSGGADFHRHGVFFNTPGVGSGCTLSGSIPATASTVQFRVLAGNNGAAGTASVKAIKGFVIGLR